MLIYFPLRSLIPTITRRRQADRCSSAASRSYLEALEGRRLMTTFSVSTLLDDGPGSLREAVTAANRAPGADVIRFAPAARDGTIALTSGQLNITDDLTIAGPGANRLSVSGNQASRVFRISGGVAASIDGLTVTQGRAVGQGGGILNEGALSLSHAVLSDNQVLGLPGATLGAVVDAFGGAIFNAGALTVRRSNFVHNRSIGADGAPGSIGSSALGGAIMSGGPASAPATATVTDSTFRDNKAVGGAAGAGASRAGIGGAIANATGTFTVSHSAFRENQAVGGLGGSSAGGFGTGAGGAIGNVARLGDAILVVSHSAFVNNRAVGGAAGTGSPPQDGRGGAIANYIFGGLTSPVTVAATTSIDHGMLLGNEAVGGAGLTGGNGQGGGIANLNGSALAVTNTLIALNRAVGGAGEGGNGGNGQGGGIFNGGPSQVGTPRLTLQRSIVTLNRADGGPASSGGSTGMGTGGGLYLAPGGVASADGWTWVFANGASTSDDNVSGILD